MRGGVGNVPLSTIVRVSDDASLVPTAPCTIDFSLSRLSYTKPFILIPLVSCFSGWIQPQLVTYCHSQGKNGALSPQCHLLPFPVCLLCLPYQSFLISRRLWPDASWALGSGKSPRQRAGRVCHSLPSTSYSTRYIWLFSHLKIGMIIGFVILDQFILVKALRSTPDLWQAII